MALIKLGSGFKVAATIRKTVKKYVNLDVLLLELTMQESPCFQF